jgi:hypothetical protein
MLHIREIVAQDIHCRIQIIHPDIDHLAHNRGKQVCNGASMGAAALIPRGNAVWGCVKPRRQGTSGADNPAPA